MALDCSALAYEDATCELAPRRRASMPRAPRLLPRGRLLLLLDRRRRRWDSKEGPWDAGGTAAEAALPRLPKSIDLGSPMYKRPSSEG